MQVRRTANISRRPQGPAGFTLAEALLASVVMAIVAGFALTPIIAAEQNRMAADRLKHAVALGQGLMDEVLARPSVAPGLADNGIGPAPGETSRKAFQTVDAFAGYSESGTGALDYEQSPIGSEETTGLWRSVSVQYVSYPGQQAADTNGLMLVRVTVYDGSAAIVNLARLVNREG